MQDLDPSAASWRKSSRSSGNGQCVEAAALGTRIAVRDSKNPQGDVLIVTHDEWRRFTARARSATGKRQQP
jgi:hypothetical protein